MRDLQEGIVESTFLTPAEFRRYIELYNQRREIGYALFAVDAFLGRVTIDDAAISAHYESNQARYQTTETVDLEYVELSLADIAATVDVTDDALRKAYDEERDRFQTTEERHARHILIAIDKGDEEAARAKAAAIADAPAQGRGLREARGRSIRRRRHESAGRRPRLDDAARRDRSRTRCSRCKSARSAIRCAAISAST